MTTTRRLWIQRTLTTAALAGALIGGAMQVSAAPATATSPFPFVPALASGSSTGSGKTVRFNAVVNPLGGSIDVTRSIPTTGINYRTLVALTCTGAPPTPTSQAGKGTGAPQLLNPAAEGDLTLLCPVFLLSFGHSTTANVSGIL